MSNRVRKWRKRFFLTLLVVVGTVVTWAAAVAIGIVLAGARRPDARGDVAIVLGAAVWDGKPSPVFAERIHHAIRLYQRGQVRCLIFTGGVGDDDALAEGEVARRYAVARGIPPEAILVERKSVDTAGNLSGARTLMRASGLRTAVLVSDPYHLQRASVLACRKGIQYTRSPTPTTRFTSFRSKARMLARETWFVTRLLFTGR